MSNPIPAPAAGSPSRRLADELLRDRGGLDAYVAERRRAGKSWRVIARDLYEDTQRSVDVTDFTLRSWYPQHTGRARAS